VLQAEIQPLSMKVALAPALMFRYTTCVGVFHLLRGTKWAWRPIFSSGLLQPFSRMVLPAKLHRNRPSCFPCGRGRIFCGQTYIHRYTHRHRVVENRLLQLQRSTGNGL